MIFITLILLNVCHWFADYSHLSTDKMLAAKRFGAPIGPIFEHALWHSLLMGSVVLVIYNLELAFLTGLIQLISHFFIDLLKGKLNKWFPVLQSPANRSHWYIFGADQLLHQLIIILMVVICTQ